MSALQVVERDVGVARHLVGEERDLGRQPGPRARVLGGCEPGLEQPQQSTLIALGANDLLVPGRSRRVGEGDLRERSEGGVGLRAQRRPELGEPEPALDPQRVVAALVARGDQPPQHLFAARQRRRRAGAVQEHAPKKCAVAARGGDALKHLDQATLHAGGPHRRVQRLAAADGVGPERRREAQVQARRVLRGGSPRVQPHGLGQRLGGAAVPKRPVGSPENGIVAGVCAEFFEPLFAFGAHAFPVVDSRTRGGRAREREAYHAAQAPDNDAARTRAAGLPSPRDPPVAGASDARTTRCAGQGTTEIVSGARVG